MANKRYRLVKEADDADVSQFTLKDLLDFSSKAEDSAAKLLSASVDSSNKRLQSLVTKFKSVAAEITTYISHLIMNGGVDQEEDARIALESKKIKESAKSKYFKRKKLKESEEDDQHETEMNGDDHTYKTYMEEDEDTDQDSGEDEAIPPPNTATKNDADVKKGQVVIDLTEPFERAIEGLDDTQFDQFKSDVVSKLEGAIDPIESEVDASKADEFTKSIEALSASNSAEDFDLGMNQIYDFADANGIIVETVKRVTKKKVVKTTKKK